MSREEIGEGIKEHLIACFKAKGCSGAFYNSFADSFSKSLPVLLDGLGVVIKVDREFPEDQLTVEYLYGGYPVEGYGREFCAREQEALDKAGYVAVESLIGEV